MTYIPIFALIVIAGIFVLRESSGYNIVEYDITTDKDISPVSFVMLSDLHDTDVTHDKNKRLMDSIDSLKPDFVVLAGDMITSYMQPVYNSDKTFELLKSLAGKYRVYYGLGNHEQRYKEEPLKFPGKYDGLVTYVKELGIVFLSDDHADTDDNGIRIYGFDIPIENYKRGVRTQLPEGIMQDRLGTCDKEKFTILLAHTPDYFDDYAKWGPDLVLSGHIHGGIVGIPGIGGVLSPQLRLFPKYDFGKFEKDKTTLIVSRGIGWHSFPIRIFNKAELVRINIHSNRGDKDGDQR